MVIYEVIYKVYILYIHIIVIKADRPPSLGIVYRIQ